MKVLINKLCWCVHRALCRVGVHAPEEVFTFDEEAEDFVTRDWFCAVCTKEWEEK